jgi:formylmethanofuran dehydrogenase subunit E
VKGLDALDGTPVLDIKPHVPVMDHPDEAARRERLRVNPRVELNRLILEEDWQSLLLKTGELHGHFCPFVALGVRAGAYALSELGLTSSEGMEDIVAIVETNSCFSDGIQYTTGCTFGNNGLIYRDYGKTAFTLATRDGSALRVHVKQRDNFVREHSPEAAELFQQVVARREGTPEAEQALKQAWTKLAFQLVQLPVDELFDVYRDVSVELPDYAPIYDSVVCERCGEKIMAPRAVQENGAELCIPCAAAEYLQLDGQGLSHIKPEQ